jgi:DNA helicase II / ATP-dependent DNA helicase PcrA
MKNLVIKYNQKQLKAINHLNGPMLTVAGAGTGKTSVLIGRLINLYLNHKIDLDKILLLTFTEKAAGEMEGRADTLLPYGSFDTQIYTFHGLAEKVLREFALEIGLNPNFKLLNSTEQWIFFQKNLNHFKLDYYKPLGSPHKFISEILKHFSRLKDENISSKNYLDYVEKIKKSWKNETDRAEILEYKKTKELAHTYKQYNQLLLNENYLDFGDLIVYCLKLLTERPNILKIFQKRFSYIMVDEFQDTNWAQYELVKLLAKKNHNLMVVGDDDQAIYKFRGASLANIMQFKEDYPKAKELLLTDNYRSYQEILDKAYLLIKNNNPYRLEEKLGINKKIKSKIKGELGEKVVFYNYANFEEELSQVAKKIKEIKKKNKAKLSDFAVLTRSNKVAEEFSSGLSKLGISNHFMSLRGLYRKDIIINTLAYLRVISDYHQNVSLFRLFNLKNFNIKYSQIVEINRFARTKNLSLFEALEKVDSINNLENETIKKIKNLVNLIKKNSQLAKDKLASEIFLSFVKESGLIASLDYDRDQAQFSYLNQFYKKIKNFEENLNEARLADFIETLDLEIEAGDSGSLVLDFIDNESVKIMTVHGAKGLEFSYVFLISLMERRFPSDNRQDKIELAEKLIKEKIDNSKDRHIEEERRLFYVAMTRAKKYLHLSAWWGEGDLRERLVSRFVIEAGFSREKEKTKKTKINLLKDLNFNKEEIKKDLDLILPSRFSFSQLVAYDNCPMQYKYAFILKVPVSGDKASLIFGRLMHKVLCDFLSPLSIGGQADIFEDKKRQEVYLKWSRLLKIYQQNFISDGYVSKQEKENYYKQGLESLRLFFHEFKKQKNKILYLEKNFSFRLDNDIIKGTIDRIDKLADNSIKVIDYKTGKSHEKLSFKDKRQLIIYQLFLERSLNFSVSSLNYYYLIDGTWQSFFATDKEKEKVELELREQISAIKKRQFKAKPSKLCNYCDFKEICPWREI